MGGEIPVKGERLGVDRALLVLVPAGWGEVCGRDARATDRVRGACDAEKVERPPPPHTHTDAQRHSERDTEARVNTHVVSSTACDIRTAEYQGLGISQQGAAQRTGTGGTDCGQRRLQ